MALYTIGQLVQSSPPSISGANNSTQQSLAFAAPPQAGSLLIAFVSTNATAQTFTVSDTVKNVWNPLPFFSVATLGGLQMFYVKNNCSSQYNTVTATASTSAIGFDLYIAEYFGGGTWVGNQASTSGSLTLAQVNVAVPTIAIDPTPNIGPAGTNYSWGIYPVVSNGVILVCGVKVAANLSTAVSGTTQRQNDSTFTAYGDNNTLQNPVAASAVNLGWNLSLASTVGVIGAAFKMPNLGGIPI